MPNDLAPRKGLRRVAPVPYSLFAIVSFVFLKVIIGTRRVPGVLAHGALSVGDLVIPQL